MQLMFKPGSLSQADRLGIEPGETLAQDPGFDDVQHNAAFQRPPCKRQSATAHLRHPLRHLNCPPGLDHWGLASSAVIGQNLSDPAQTPPTEGWRTMDRDLIGYGASPPNPNWPDNARIAVNFVLNFEEGSEPSIPDGDPASEWALTEYGSSNPGVVGRDLAAEGMFAYGSRVGFWRILRLFQERGLPMTIFGCALALERNPPAAAAIKEAGYDICCHGWRWEKHFELPEALERERIAKAVASIQSTMGERPLGWYCRSGPGVNTRRLLVQEGGFLYDSDAYDDELPYWTQVEGKPHLIVPYSLSTNDSKFGRGTFATGDDFFHYCRDAFDMLYQEGRTHPKMLSIGLHMRIMGHPARAAGLQRLLDHMSRFRGVWITRRLDIAQHWVTHFPAPQPPIAGTNAQ
jgi:allantoinase